MNRLLFIKTNDLFALRAKQSRFDRIVISLAIEPLASHIADLLSRAKRKLCNSSQNVMCSNRGCCIAIALNLKRS